MGNTQSTTSTHTPPANMGYVDPESGEIDKQPFLRIKRKQVEEDWDSLKKNQKRRAAQSKHTFANTQSNAEAPSNPVPSAAAPSNHVPSAAVASVATPLNPALSVTAASVETPSDTASSASVAANTSSRRSTDWYTSLFSCSMQPSKLLPWHHAWQKHSLLLNRF